MVTVEIIAALISILAGFAANLSTPMTGRLLETLAELFGVKLRKKVETYSERLSRLTEELTKSSAEVDNILFELTQVAQERERTVRELEIQLAGLTEDEQKLKQRIQELKNTPLSVAEHFAELTEQGEKRSARRDYLLFGAGVVVSTAISITLNWLGFGG